MKTTSNNKDKDETPFIR